MTWVDWVVIVCLCLVSLGIGLYLSKRSVTRGAEGFFTGDRNLPWWAIGFSNCATYQSNNGGLVMLVLVYGLAGNWLWWSSWIIWMPLVAIIWARLWRRMRIVTTAELITVRYGGRPARIARKIYALLMFCISILIIAYITGFFAKILAPLVPFPEWKILLIFGGVTAIYTMLGGLTSVVFVDVVQFCILLLGSLAFFFLAIPQQGGWEEILSRVNAARSGDLTQSPVTAQVPLLTIIVFIIQGLFFAGSPTAGEGMTAQRFMAARNERHAIGGQLFNTFIALSLRTIPFIGLGIIAMSLFWTSDLAGDPPPGFTVIEDPAYAWAELVKACHFPAGFVGLLVAVEAAAFMSTLSSLVNWGSSFIVNDFYKAFFPKTTDKGEIQVSRITTLALFLCAAVIAILFVEGMVGWLIFINSAMVVFLLPLAWFRFFWARFNVWGELAASVIGLPLSIIIWFGLDFQSKPFWQGIGLLLGCSLVTLITVMLCTLAESEETLKRFFQRCRPVGLWGRISSQVDLSSYQDPPLSRLLIDSLLGIAACLGLVVATNAMFVGGWQIVSIGLVGTVGCGAVLLKRMGAKQIAGDDL